MTDRTGVVPHRRAIWIVAAAALVAFGASGARAASPIQQGTLIHLADGDVQGLVGGQAREFLGIPFAAPPVGALRWRPPAPAIPWPGVRPATAFGPACPQLASLQAPASNVEDCLFLNVFTPDPAPSRPRSVMVWFHGGSNQVGSAGDAVPVPGIPGHFYDAQVLAQERNVVVVTVNYRLNAFGFLAHAALAGEDPQRPYAGNQGLLDQQAALRWVQANIAAFGGNPKRVTIFGESAGSWDVCYHMVSPGSRGLFRRAIGESGGCTPHQPTAAQGAANAEALAAAVGCGGAPDELACMRQVSADTLLANLGSGDFGPVVDGGVLPDQPRTLFDSGQFAKVPYLLGSNSDEGTLFFIGVPPVTTEAEYQAALQTRYGSLASQVEALYPAASFASPQAALVRAYGDEVLVCSTYDTARRASAGGARTYLYNFSRVIPIPILQALGLGAFHGAEIAYVFGSVTPPTADDATLAQTMRGYWSRFAEHGNPNGHGAVRWPRYRRASDQRLDLDVQPTVLTGFRRHECDFWWSVYDSQF